MVRVFWLSAGWLSLGLGGIGIVLPLLPTTPFVILAACCFARGSPALALRLQQSPTFGPIIADWRANGAIAPRYKLMALAMMGGALVLALAMHVPAGVLIAQTTCMAAAAFFILTRPHSRATPDQQPAASRGQPEIPSGDKRQIAGV